jgi:hypothetical protein
MNDVAALAFRSCGNRSSCTRGEQLRKSNLGDRRRPEQKTEMQLRVPAEQADLSDRSIAGWSPTAAASF